MGRLTQAQQDKLPDSAFCGRGRTFYVTQSGDIPNAVNSLGRAADDAERAQIKACILKKARMHGWMNALPQAWMDEMKSGGMK